MYLISKIKQMLLKLANRSKNLDQLAMPEYNFDYFSTLISFDLQISKFLLANCIFVQNNLSRKTVNVFFQKLSIDMIAPLKSKLTKYFGGQPTQKVCESPGLFRSSTPISE